MRIVSEGNRPQRQTYQTRSLILRQSKSSSERGRLRSILPKCNSFAISTAYTKRRSARPFHIPSNPTTDPIKVEPGLVVIRLLPDRQQHHRLDNLQAHQRVLERQVHLASRETEAGLVYGARAFGRD